MKNVFENAKDLEPIVWADKELDRISKEAKNLIEEYEYEYDYNYRADSIKNIIIDGNIKKGLQESILSKSPDYIPESHMVKTRGFLTRETDHFGINVFWEWIRLEINKKLDDFSNINKNHIVLVKNLYTDETFDTTYSEYLRNKDLILIELDPFIKILKVGASYEYTCNTIYLNYDQFENIYKKWDSFYHIMWAWYEPTISYNIANKINEIYGDIIKARVGQRTTKIVRKWADHEGFTKIKDMQKKSWIDNSGIYHEKEIDNGWNGQFVKYCDCITPLKSEFDFYISVNPIDYITSSFGNGWGSCHTIDKTNTRETNSSYSGCYSGGCISYMLDDKTVVMYALNTSYKGNSPELQDKIKRCMFHIDIKKGIIIQGRVYPDGRDGGTYPQISKEMRDIFLSVYSECLGCSKNEWTIDANNEYTYRIAKTQKGSLNYPDYNTYSDCVTIWGEKLSKTEIENRIDSGDNGSKIFIGALSRCVCCGKVHYDSEYIMCESCRSDDYIICQRCGERIPRYSDMISIGDYFFCDSLCADEAGYVYSVHINEWVDCNDTFWDDYYEDYFYYDSLDTIITEDGEYYADEASAECHGYVKTSDGWVFKE